MDVLANYSYCLISKGGKLETEKEYTLYKHTNLINGKVYIGITCEKPYYKRFGKGGSKYKRNKHFWGAIQLYGWDNFSHEILLENLTEKEACEKEKEYIKKYEATNPDKGYNVDKGGKLSDKEIREKQKKAHEGKKLTEEHKKNISKGLGQGVNNVNYGRKQTPEAILHNSMAKTGQNNPNWGKHLKESTREKIKKKNSKPVLQYDLEGNFIKEWESGKIAAQELGLNYTGINNCLRCVRHSSGGFVWVYKDEEKIERYKQNKEIIENEGIRALNKHKKQ